jgi:hypothetical protein
MFTRSTPVSAAPVRKIELNSRPQPDRFRTQRDKFRDRPGQNPATSGQNFVLTPTSPSPQSNRKPHTRQRTKQPSITNSHSHNKCRVRTHLSAHRAAHNPGKCTRASMTSSRCSTVSPLLSNRHNTKDISRRALAPVETSQAETRRLPRHDRTTGSQNNHAPAHATRNHTDRHRAGKGDRESTIAFRSATETQDQSFHEPTVVYSQLIILAV